MGVEGGEDGERSRESGKKREKNDNFNLVIG